MSLNPGDYVKLRLAKREIEGIILESHESNIVLLKLKSGYNIGIQKENILDSKVIKKYHEEKLDTKIPSGKGLPSIGLIVTGGTIASKLDTKTGGVKAITEIAEFSKFYPSLFERVKVKRLEIPFMLDSSSMTSDEWLSIAKIVEKMLNDDEIKGVIVTHGTDTLHYTSAALSFFLKELNKPIALTYSQRSIDRGSSDASLNLDCAAQFVLSDAAEIALIGHATRDDEYCYAMPANKVRKMHTSRRDAFKTINSSPIAKIWKDRIEFLSGYRPRNNGNIETAYHYNKKVTMLKFYPGQTPEILEFLGEKYKGIIIEATGLGQLPTSEAKHNWVPTIKKLIKKGVIICAAPQTLYGRLNPKVYSAGRELENAGVIFLKDILPETALVKLSWVLGNKSWNSYEKIKEIMLQNISGEYSELLTK